MRHVTTPDYGTEVVLRVENGMQLLADGDDRDGTSYVRVVDPDGLEVAYWNEDEWREDPAAVMGAIIGALCRVATGDPERASRIPTEAETEQGLPAPAPPFETSTSPLYRSDDGRLEIYAERQTVPAGWIVADKTDDHVERFTLKRETADAFVAGYDYARHAVREEG